MSFPWPRRRLLSTAAALAAAAAGGGRLVRFVEEARGMPARPPQLRSRWVMVIDLRRCDGCEKCTQACQQMHRTAPDVQWIKVYELKTAAGDTYFLPRPCMQCANAPCYHVCPVGATFYSPEGVVLIDPDRCIGCRLCMVACPYEARYFTFSDPPAVPAGELEHPTGPEFPVPQQRGTVSKCVFCVHRLRQEKLPACVEACTMEAIYIGDWERDLATNGRETVVLSAFLSENDAFRWKDEYNTHPSVYYIAGHGQALESKYRY